MLDQEDYFTFCYFFGCVGFIHYNVLTCEYISYSYEYNYNCTSTHVLYTIVWASILIGTVKST